MSKKTVPMVDDSIGESDYIREALPTFVQEAHEQLEAMEDYLLKLEDDPTDRDLLDALFRCAHTIKGSSGVFGLDSIVAFTHHVEDLLERVRSGEVAWADHTGSLLLSCGDHIRALIDAISDPDTVVDEAVGLQLLDRIARAVGAPAPDAPPPVGDGPESAERNQSAGQSVRESAAQYLAVRFGTDSFRNGLDPLAILSYLAGMGRVRLTLCDTDRFPPLDQLDPEDCHLTVGCVIDTEAEPTRFEQAFEFFHDDCELALWRPADDDAMPDQVTNADLLAMLARLRNALPATGNRADADAATEPTPGGATDLVTAASVERRAHPPGRRTADADMGFVRVPATRLDSVINLLGELMIAGAGASLLAQESRQRKLIESNRNISRLVEAIRNQMLQLRMVPIGDTFARLRRVVRDTAAELGKDVQLTIHGGETELDKSMVERIADPLTHLVRNALDHGLELPEQRLQAGKPAQGNLTLSAFHDSGSVVVRIEDDGKGIQRRKVLQRAWDRGLIENGAVPPDEDILKLIFEAGFSTAEAVTNLSGRGVGMDVVRSNVESLRGSVSLASVEGQGACVEMRLPLTLAIIDGFLVAVGRSKFIVPLEAVLEVIENRGSVVSLDAAGRGCLELRGKVLPVVCLQTLYGLPGTLSERSSVVVLRSGKLRYGVIVEHLLGQHQTVIKPLGPLLHRVRGVSGSSILGTGEVALIVDIHSLARLATPAAGSFTARPRAAVVA